MQRGRSIGWMVHGARRAAQRTAGSLAPRQPRRPCGAAARQVGARAPAGKHVTTHAFETRPNPTRGDKTQALVQAARVGWRLPPANRGRRRPGTRPALRACECALGAAGAIQRRPTSCLIAGRLAAQLAPRNEMGSAGWACMLPCPCHCERVKPDGGRTMAGPYAGAAPGRGKAAHSAGPPQMQSAPRRTPLGPAPRAGRPCPRRAACPPLQPQAPYVRIGAVPSAASRPGTVHGAATAQAPRIRRMRTEGNRVVGCTVLRNVSPGHYESRSQ
jgi:hypothetical protein